MSATLWVEITVRTGGWTWDKLEFLYYFVHMRCPHGRSGQNWMAPLDIVSRSRPTSFLVFYMLVLPFTWTITNSGGFSERGRTVA